jgi:sulfur-oxidizing protein SoxY
MDEPARAPTRRDLLVATGTCVLAGVVAPAPVFAQEKPAEAKPEAGPQSWETAMRTVTGDAKIVDGRITMDLPEIAENGNVVPMNITVASAMARPDFVRTLRLYSTGNPQPLIATFRFFEDSGKAAISGRMRLAKTQDVYALAELADGTFLRGRKNVKVTIGGCGG